MIYNSSSYSLLNQNGQRKYLNQKERKRFYKVLQAQTNEVKLLCEMLYWTGARISEILNTRLSHLDQSNGTITIESLKKRKKGIYRQIPLPPEFLKRILNNFRTCQLENKIWSFSRRTANRYIKKVMIKANIIGPMACPKGLRHSFAINCLVKNVPLTLIKKWLGHASLTTTSIYLNVASEEERVFALRMWR